MVNTKQILYKEYARQAIESGIEIMVEAVAVTLGPRGRNVVIEKSYGLPYIINDGVSIAKEVTLQDHMQNTGICLVRQAALKTNQVAGDGTTTSTVLAHALIREGMKNLIAGVNPVSLKVGMTLATKFAINCINDFAQPVQDLTTIAQVASLSAGNDDQVGAMIAEALEKVGKDGIISLEEGKSTITELEIAEGLTFEKGYISPYFVNVPEKREVVFENPYIFILDKKITLVQQELMPILELIKGTMKPLVIIADDVAQDALSTLVLNNLRGTIQVAAVRAPGFGALKKSLLQDIGVLTDGTVVTEETGLSLKNLKLSYFGTAKKVTITENSTSIISLNTSEAVDSHCERLRKLVTITDDSYEKQQLQDRVAKLRGGVAVMKVGAITETEMKEKKLRLEDSINATKAALDEGIVPGGGTVLIHTSSLLKTWAKNNLVGEELRGALIIANALIAPLLRIAHNSGKNGPLLVEEILQNSFSIGYDALNGEIVDMYKIGIIDPAKVTRSSLQNAVSIASMVLTTECMIVEAGKTKPETLKFNK